MKDTRLVYSCGSAHVTQSVGVASPGMTHLIQLLPNCSYDVWLQVNGKDESRCTFTTPPGPRRSPLPASFSYFTSCPSLSPTPLSLTSCPSLSPPLSLTSCPSLSPTPLSLTSCPSFILHPAPPSSSCLSATSEHHSHHFQWCHSTAMVLT